MKTISLSADLRIWFFIGALAIAPGFSIFHEVLIHSKYIKVNKTEVSAMFRIKKEILFLISAV